MGSLAHRLAPGGAALPSSGHHVLDDDHRLLLELATRFTEAAHADNQPRAIIIFEALLTAVQAHFKREEWCLGAVLDPDLAEHRRLHEEVMAQLLTVRAESFLLLRCWPAHAVDLVAGLLRRSCFHDRGLLARAKPSALSPLLVASPL